MPVGYDTIVIGLGGMGSAAAADLATRGRRVLGLEQFGAVHDRGSSHGESRMVRQAYAEDPRYVPLLFRAYERWQELRDERARPILRVTGGLTLGAEGSPMIAGALAAARQWDLPVEQLTAAGVRRRFPTFTPASDVVGVFDPGSGFVRPEATLRANLRRARVCGADLRFGQPVHGWSVTTDGDVRVETADGVHTAASLVLAPGAWAAELLAGLDLPLSVERQVQVWFRPRGPLAAFDSSRHPVYAWQLDDPAGQVFYGFPADPALPIGLKVAFHHSGTLTGADELDRQVHDRDVSRLRQALADRIPHLAGDLADARVCMYTNTPDEHFVVARHPGHANVVLACGFSGHGFKFVPVIGEILADLAVDGTTRHDLSLFDPSRFADQSGAANRSGSPGRR